MYSVISPLQDFETPNLSKCYEIYEDPSLYNTSLGLLVFPVQRARIIAGLLESSFLLAEICLLWVKRF